MTTPVIVKWEWDFGDGQKSSAFSPSHFYQTGYYDVTLIGTGDDGTVYTRKKSIYIIVNEDNQSLDNPNYLTNYKSMHYGWKDEHGFGWSENSRDTWVLPFTSHSVYNYDDDGTVYTIVWDANDRKPYIINTRDTYSESAIYVDKANADGTGGTEFTTTVVFPELTAEMTHYDLHHLETNVFFRPEILRDDFRGAFDVDFSLIIDSREEPVETQFNQDINKEIVFYYQNDAGSSTRTRQLKIDTSTSEYQLLNYEAYFKSNDRFKRPYGSLTDTQNVMATLGSMGFWVTRTKGYEFDMVSKTTYPITGETAANGPDGNTGSAVTFASNQTYILNSATTGVLTAWSTYDLTLEGWYAVTTKDGYTLYKTVPFTWTNVFLPTGSYFDVRLVLTGSAISDDDLLLYADKLEQFLPRF